MDIVEPAETDLKAPLTLPAVPLRDNVVFPAQLAPLAAGRPRSVAALEEAGDGDGRVVLAIQRDADHDDVDLDDVHPIAVIAHVGAFRRLPTGGAHALVEGRERVRITRWESSGDSWRATVEEAPDVVAESTEIDALSGTVKTLFAEYVGAGAAVSPDVAMAMARSNEPALIADIAATAPDLTFEERMSLLQQLDVRDRLRSLVPLMARQSESRSCAARSTRTCRRRSTSRSASTSSASSCARCARSSPISRAVRAKRKKISPPVSKTRGCPSRSRRALSRRCPASSRSPAPRRRWAWCAPGSTGSSTSPGASGRSSTSTSIAPPRSSTRTTTASPRSRTASSNG